LQLASDNTIDIAAVKAKFVASAGEQWKTTVETQVDTCWAELNSNIKRNNMNLANIDTSLARN
jgi:hypothetical protein